MAPVDSALAIIRAALSRAARPYVAWSGGKDSLVLAHLVHSVDPSVQLVYSDDELLFPEHAAFVREAKVREGSRLRIVSGGSVHAGWLRPWEDAPYWREPEPDMEWLPRDRLGRRGRLSRLAPSLGYDGAFLGLRRTESRRRAMLLEGGTGLEMIRGYWHATPLIDWTDDDVWAYIRKHRLPYCPVYDRLADVGVALRHQRVGPLALCPGEHLWTGWPELYVALVRRYGWRWTRPRRRPRGMRMLTWLDLPI